MGLIQKIFGRVRLPTAFQGSAFKTVTGYQPVFTNWNGRLYESELVRASIHARARHASKLEIQFTGSAKPTLRTRMQIRPNEWQTWGQFLYRVSTILDVQNTCFLVKILDDLMRPVGVFPVLPSQCEVVEYRDEAYLRYSFSNGERAATRLADTGILTRHQYRDDFFGEKNTALNPTMEQIHMQTQAIGEAVKNSNTFRFMARMNNFMNDGDLAKERKRFDRNNLQADASGGLLLFPSAYTDIKQITSTPYVINADQQKIIQTNVFDYYGTNEKVLQNSCTGDEWAAFYEGETEPFGIQLTDVMTNMFFTDREQAAGSRVFATANRLQYLSNKDKIEVSKEMGDRGQFMIDEVRSIWGLPPLPDGKGRTFTLRGEYYLRGEDGTITRHNNSQKEEEGKNAEEQ